MTVPAPLVLIAGIALTISLSKFLFYAMNRSDKLTVVVFLAGFPFFCFGVFLILDCFLFDPLPIYGIMIGPWHGAP